MKKLKGYSLSWWITGIIGLMLLLTVIVSEIYINYSLFFNNSVTYNQKICNFFGVILVCYGWNIIIDKLVQIVRKQIRKHRKPSYSKEKIEIIKKQMDKSVDHLKDNE